MNKRLSVSTNAPGLRTPEERVKLVAEKIEAGIQVRFSGLSRIADFAPAFQAAQANTKTRIDDRLEPAQNKPRLAARLAQLQAIQDQLNSDRTIEFLGFVGFNDNCAVKFDPGQDISEYHGVLLRRNRQVVLETLGSAYVHTLGPSKESILKSPEFLVYSTTPDGQNLSALLQKDIPPHPISDQGRVCLVTETGDIDTGFYVTNWEDKNRLVVSAPVLQIQLIKLDDFLSSVQHRQMIQDLDLRFAFWESSADGNIVLGIGKKTRPNMTSTLQTFGLVPERTLNPTHAAKIGGMMCNNSCPGVILEVFLQSHPSTQISTQPFFSSWFQGTNNSQNSLNRGQNTRYSSGLLYLEGPVNREVFSIALTQKHKALISVSGEIL